MVNGNKKHTGKKKKGHLDSPVDNDLLDRIIVRRQKLIGNQFTYQTFARNFGYKTSMVVHAIHETRKSPLAKEIQNLIAGLPLRGSNASREN